MEANKQIPPLGEIPKLPPPDPKRFEKFCEFPDKDGFELPTGEKFYYEEDGGWYDEYRRYYNANGELVEGEGDDEDEYEDVEDEEEKKDDVKPILQGNVDAGGVDNYEDYCDDLAKPYIEDFEIDKDEQEIDKEIEKFVETHIVNEKEKEEIKIQDEKKDKLFVYKKIDEKNKNIDNEIILSISNLKNNITEEQVLNFFKKEIGEKFKFNKILLKKSKGFAVIFVNSEEIAQSIQTLNEKIFEGKKILITKATEKSKASIINEAKEELLKPGLSSNKGQPKQKMTFNTQFKELNNTSDTEPKKL